MERIIPDTKILENFAIAILESCIVPISKEVLEKERMTKEYYCENCCKDMKVTSLGECPECHADLRSACNESSTTS